MTATFTIHFEMAETDVAWWAETADVERLSVAAPTLMGLRRLIDEAVKSGPGKPFTREAFDAVGQSAKEKFSNRHQAA